MTQSAAYKILETETHYIAVLRPDSLFDTSTIEKPAPEDREKSLRAVHRFTGKPAEYAIAYNKGFARWVVEGFLRYKNPFVEEDNRDLLRMKRPLATPFPAAKAAYRRKTPAT